MTKKINESLIIRDLTCIVLGELDIPYSIVEGGNIDVDEDDLYCLSQVVKRIDEVYY